MKYRKHSFMAAAFAAIFTFNPLFTLSAQEINPELQEEYTISASKHKYDLNPHTSSYTAEAQVLNGLYEGLFTYDPITLDPLYAVAESYRLSRDKKRWTFILRKDIKFSDGSEIKAENVRNSWLKMISNPQAPYASLFDIVKGSEAFRTGKGTAEDVGIFAVDDYTLSIHLNSPASHLPKLLCMPSFAIVSDNDNVFSGPYVLDSMNENEIQLVKNENYYDAEHTNLKKITFLLSDDEKENTFLYNTGKIDWISGNFDSKTLLKADDLRISAEFGTQYFFFKNRANSIWNHQELRAALLEAAPWSTLREQTYVPATTFVYPLAGYPNVEGYVFTDEKDAFLLMKEARKSLNIDEDEVLTLKIAIVNSDYMRKKASALKEAWIPLGVNLEVVELPSWSYLNMIDATDCDIYSYTWIGDFADPLAFLELFRSTSTLNVAGWKNTQFDRCLDEAALYTDENHGKLLAKAEQILLDDAMILPIQHPVSGNIINLETTGGWSLNAFDIHPLKWLFKREANVVIPNVVMK